MNGSQQAILYEEVVAYQANSGIQLYALPSGGTATGGFVVSWDLDAGFSGHGWDLGNSNSPAYGYTQETIEQEVQKNNNLNEMFRNWAFKIDFSYRLNWVTVWMNTYGCVTES